VAWFALGVMTVIALIWLSMWLGGPTDCSSSPRLAIGKAMLVAGCHRR
jgi:hypothetical protein